MLLVARKFNAGHRVALGARAAEHVKWTKKRVPLVDHGGEVRKVCYLFAAIV